MSSKPVIEDVFRFLVMRSPTTANLDETGLVLQPSKEFEHACASAETLYALRDLCRDYLASKNTSKIKYYSELEQLYSGAIALNSADWSEATVANLVVHAFSINSDDVPKLKDLPEFRNSLEALSNCIVASIFLDERKFREQLVAVIRSASLVRLVSIGSNQLTSNLLTRIVLLPSALKSHFDRLRVSSGDSTDKVLIRPLACADLLVVKQEFLGYQRSELSHIENVLSGEHKSREHKRTTEVEEIYSSDTELEQQSEKDLQSTERYSLQKEVAMQIQAESQRKAGLTLSGSYGPCVEFKAQTEYDSKTAKQEASKQATAYAQDVTRKATEKLLQRVRTSKKFRRLDTMSETNVHEINNTGKLLNGVYHCLEKVYLAQTYKYDFRLLFDLIVPEPGSYLRRASKAKTDETNREEKFDLLLNDITEENYFELGVKYGATELSSPPPKQLYVNRTFSAAGDAKGQCFNASEFDIPEGYTATECSVVIDQNPQSGNPVIFVTVGSYQCGKTNPAPGDRHLTFKGSLANETGRIPFTVHTATIEGVTVSVEMKLERTQEKLNLWRGGIYQQLAGAYKTISANNSNRSSAEPADETNALAGSPLYRKQIIENELKRLSISMITQQHFNNMGAVTEIISDPPIPPEVDFAKAIQQSPFIRFCEQAFDWNHMMYLHYPYYWARKSKWWDLISVSETDKDMYDFFSAGATRVVVGVRRGFEKAVINFLEQGVISDSEPSSAEYLSIWKEIKDRESDDAAEKADGEKWYVRVPTDLVLASQPEQKELEEEFLFSPHHKH